MAVRTDRNRAISAVLVPVLVLVGVAGGGVGVDVVTPVSAVGIAVGC
jgi:hypothetical protein